MAVLDRFDAQPLANETQEFSYYNEFGGDRGEVKPLTGGGDVEWWEGSIRAAITSNWAFAGIWESLNGPIRNGEGLNFNSLFAPEIRTDFQPKVNALLFKFDNGQGPITFKLETPSKQAVWLTTQQLTGGPAELLFDLPDPVPDNVQALVVTVDGLAGNFFELDEIAIEVTSPDVGDLEPAVWSAAALLGNYDRDLKISGDRKNFPAADFANVPVTGGTALVAAQLVEIGVISTVDASPIVEDITETFLSLPRHNGLLPHFVHYVGGHFEIVPQTEFSSVDTIVGVLSLLEARQILELPTSSVEQLIRGINWEELILPNGTVSHGYTDAGTLLPSGWDVWGSESFLVAWAYAAARPESPLANLVYATPPTWDGAEFNDELAALFFPMNSVDAWGNDWRQYRRGAARQHWEVYDQVDAPICCLDQTKTKRLPTNHV